MISKPSLKSNKSAIINSVRKLIETEIYIECTEDMNARGIEVEYLRESPFLAAEKINDTPKYKMLLQKNDSDEPLGRYPQFFMPLYGYAELIGQIISFHRGWIYDKSGDLPNTLENIQIKRYLIRRLEVMRNAGQRVKDFEKGSKSLRPESASNAYLRRRYLRIVYERKSHRTAGGTAGLLASIGIVQPKKSSEVESNVRFLSDDSWLRKRRQVHDKVMKILDFYKRIHYIKDYELLEDNGQPYGVIVYNRESKARRRKPKMTM